MVYNAMKMFMEINPQLFDDCSHAYNERQNNAEQREKSRRDKWKLLEEQAEKRKKGLLPSSQSASRSSASSSGSTNTPADGVLGRIDEVDELTQDSQQRLNALKLQDEASPVKERRLRELESQNSVSTLMSLHAS